MANKKVRAVPGRVIQMLGKEFDMDSGRRCHGIGNALPGSRPSRRLLVGRVDLARSRPATVASVERSLPWGGISAPLHMLRQRGALVLGGGDRVEVRAAGRTVREERHRALAQGRAGPLCEAPQLSVAVSTMSFEERS